MGYNRDQRDGEALAGWIVGMLVVAAVVAGVAFATFVVRCTPVAAKAVVNLTKLMLPQWAALLHRTIRWPASGQIRSQGIASVLGLSMFGILGAVLGLTCFLLGASPVVILITTGLGAMVGAVAGAASVSQPNNQGNREDLDSYINF